LTFHGKMEYKHFTIIGGNGCHVHS